MADRIIEVTRRGRKGETGEQGVSALAAITTGGSSTVYTITNTTPITSYADGYGVTTKAHATNGATPTANVDILGAKSIKKLSGGSVVAIAAGDMVVNQFYVLHYSSDADALILFAKNNDTIGVDVQAWDTDLDNVSGTNTGDEVAATTTTLGIVKKATTAEAIAGTEADVYADVVDMKATIGVLGHREPDLRVTYELADATAGASVTSGADRTLTLNTLDINNISGVALSSNQLTGLPAGDYYVKWTTFFNRAVNLPAAAQTFFYDDTGAADLVRGTYGACDSYAHLQGVGSGMFTLSTTSTAHLGARVDNTLVQGSAVGTMGRGRVYTILEIWKVV